MNTLLLALRYSLFGEWLEFAHAAQALLAGIALTLATKRIWEQFGLGSALFFLGLAYSFLRIFVGTTLSESLGFTASLFAVPLLLSGVYDRSRFHFILACIVLAFSQVARPGPIFLLPALVFWAAWAYGPSIRQRLITIALTSLALISPFVANKASIGYAPNTASANSNFSYTFYGLTIGTNWKGAEEAAGRPDFPQKEGEAPSSAMYRVGLENIKNRPGVFIITLFYNLGHSLVRVPAEIANSVLSLAVKRSGLSPPSLVIGGLISVLLFTPFAISLFWKVKSKEVTQGLFWAIAIFSIVAAFPIIIRDGSFRVLAGVYPILLTFGATVLAVTKNPNTKVNLNQTTWLSAGIPIALIIGSFSLPPLVIALHPQLPKYPNRAPKELVVLRNEITAITIVENQDFERVSILKSIKDRLSIWKVDDYRHAVDASRSEMVNEIKQLKPPFTLLMGLDAETGKENYLLIPGEAEPFRHKAYRFTLRDRIGMWRKVASYRAEPLPR